jgi:hypothetical protein
MRPGDASRLVTPDKVGLKESEKEWVTAGKFGRVQVAGIPVTRHIVE